MSDGRPGRHSPLAHKLIGGLRGDTGRKGRVTWRNLTSHPASLKTEPCAGSFGDSDAGADFLFVLK